MKIKKIIDIIDTRQYEMMLDSKLEEVWKPINGTGEDRACDRCGKSHEVHVHVELENGEKMIIGTSCAHEEDIEAQKSITNAFNLTKRLNSLIKERNRHNEVAAHWDMEWKYISQISHPEVKITVFEESVSFKIGDGDASWMGLTKSMNEATRNHYIDERRKERTECALESWKRKRMIERGFLGFRPCAKVAQKDIDRVENKLKKMLG